MTKLEKEQFYLLFWKQNVAIIPDYDEGETLIKSEVRDPREIKYLELKSLENISDKDAIECGYKNRKNFKEFIADKYNPPSYEHNDYLRSKGYATPFLNYSVEDLIKKGLIKLV